MEGRTNSLRSDKVRQVFRASAPGAGRQASDNEQRESYEAFEEFRVALDYVLWVVAASHRLFSDCGFAIQA